MSEEIKNIDEIFVEWHSQWRPPFGYAALNETIEHFEKGGQTLPPVQVHLFHRDVGETIISPEDFARYSYDQGKNTVLPPGKPSCMQYKAQAAVLYGDVLVEPEQPDVIETSRNAVDHDDAGVLIVSGNYEIIVRPRLG